MLSRIERLSELLRESAIDAFFGWSPVTLGYLTGLSEDAHERFMALGVRSDGQVHLICPALTETRARGAGIQSLTSWTDSQDPLTLFANLAQRWDLKSGIVAVDPTMPARMLLQMQSILPAALFQNAQPALSKLMAIKSTDEIELLAKAGAIADAALAAGLAAIRPGATERSVAVALMGAMEKLGGRPTFCIVAAGPNSAQPHHETSDARIAEGDVVLMDFGCALEGYQSDITRVAACGRASQEAKQIYDLVLHAHHAGRAAIRPGALPSDVDAAARNVIEAAGYGEFFMHRLGHGIGMQGHEEPYISSLNHMPLEGGNCFSVEPGVYLPGRFGVRIENIVTCIPEGHRSLNAEPSPVLIEALG